MANPDQLVSDPTPIYNPANPTQFMGQKRPELAINFWGSGISRYQINLQTVVPQVSNGAQTFIYDRISRGPLVMPALNIVRRAAFWGPARVISVNDYTKYPDTQQWDEIIIPKVQTWLDGMIYNPFRDSIKDLVHSAKVCGFSVGEKIWAVIDGYWILQTIKVKQTWDFNPKVDEYGNLTSLFHYITGQDLNPGAFIIGVWPFLHATNWLGMSILEPIFQDIQILTTLEDARAKGAALVAITPLQHTYDSVTRSAGEINSARDSIDKMESGSILHLPGMMDMAKGDLVPFDKIENVQDRASHIYSDIGLMIMEYSKRITRAIGVPDDLGMTNTSIGSLAKSKTEFDVFNSTISEDHEFTENLVNRQIIPDMIRFNWPNLPIDYRLPEWHFDELEEKYSKDLADYLKILVDTGWLDPADEDDQKFARDSLELPPKTIKPELIAPAASTQTT